MTNWKNKIVLITGGTSGIGFAAAKNFIDCGATVILTGQNEKTVEAARRELGDRAEVVRSDAGDPAAVAGLFEHVESTHGALDVLFLNAGIAAPVPIEQVDGEHFDRIFNVNVKGPLLAIKHASGLLRKGGSVVITTSVANQVGMPGMAVYAASKAAARSMVRTAAAELAPLGVRVNAVSPGPIETPIWGKMGLSPEEVEGFTRNVIAQVPMGRVGNSDEIASAVVFLASEDANFVTGEELVVDGGMAGV